MSRIKFTQIGDSNKFELAQSYAVDGVEVTAIEFFNKALEISSIHGKVMVHETWDKLKGTLKQDLITNPYDVNK